MDIYLEQRGEKDPYEGYTIIGNITYSFYNMGFWTTATLELKNIDEFRRVSDFVKPDESDTEPQTEEEYEQVIEMVDTLSKAERCAWMARHCVRLYVDFCQNVEKFELSWSGRNEIGGWAEEIAELVVAQFPDIEFHVSNQCDDDLKYGVSEQGKIKWLKLSDDVNEMFDWGIDVDPYNGPTQENWETLRQHRKERVQEMIDLGVHITPDTWPPTREQYDEEHRLKYGELVVNEHWLDDIEGND